MSTISRGQTKPVSWFTRWYRSPLFNIILVGLISLTQPGIWGALNSVGAGGQEKPYLVNAANALTYGLMVFLCFVFGAVSNKIGVKWVLVLGTLGYAPYSASLYVNNRYGTEWFVIFGGATCGIAAAALWSSEAAIALGYGKVEDRGKFTGIWLGLREFGQLIGAAMELAYNINDSARGKISYATYFILISIQCLGLPLALMVSPPQKLILSNGERMQDPTKGKNIKSEFRKVWKLLKRKEILLFLPVMIGFEWNSVYVSIYLTDYFSVRARSLASLSTSLAGTVADLWWGWFLDRKRFSRPTLAKITWFFFTIAMLALFSWQTANEKLYETTKPTLDWEYPGFGRGFASMVLFRFFDESYYMFTYWLMGCLYDDIETLSLVVGIVRSFESLGFCISYGIGASSASPMVNLAIAFAMFGIAIPTTTWLVYLVPERPVNIASDDIDLAGIGQSEEESSPDKLDHIEPRYLSAAIVASDAPHP